MVRTMFRAPESKILTPATLPKTIARLRQEKKNIVTTNGCFDLLHWGHIHYLNEARALGDVLICGVNSDKSVQKLKGPTRPLVDEQTRLLQLAGIEAVDFVVLFSEDTPEAFLEIVRPDIHVKGGDYDPDKLPERDVVERHGGQVKCLSLIDGFSTSSLIEKLKR